jgi:RNA polymerase primary sigma factor
MTNSPNAFAAPNQGIPIQTAKNRNRPIEFIRDSDSISAYRAEIKSYRSLSLEEERALCIEIDKGDKRALQALIQANLKFVVAVCHNYTGRGLPLGDLVNEGNLGLIRAAQRFDASKNFKFISYAVWWIRQGILTALAEQTRSLTISTSLVETLRKISAATRKLEQNLDRAPTLDELATASGRSTETIRASRIVSGPSISLDRAYHGEGGGVFGDTLEDDHGEATDQAARTHLLEKEVRAMLGVLGKKERAVLSLYYGIGFDTDYNLTEIGTRFQLTRERIRQIKAKALRRLQGSGVRRAATL